MLEEYLKKHLSEQVRLVKDDNFVISGKILKVYKNSILFLTDGKEMLISFDRIREICPLRRF